MSPPSVVPRGKRPYKYKGILDQPLVDRPVITPPGADPECPPDGWIASGHSAERWRRIVLEALVWDWGARQEMKREYFEKVIALADDLGIDRTSKGWVRDFTLGLVQRHEREHLCASGPPYSRLFAKYDIDPDQPEADFGLGLAIAANYVDGMKFQDASPIKGRHNAIDVIGFVLATAAVRYHLGCGQYGGSDRKVAEILGDYHRLSKIIPPAAAKVVVAMNGNMNGNLSDSAVRGYLREMKAALPAVLENRATAFQKQLVEEVYPFFLREKRRLDCKKTGQSQQEN